MNEENGESKKILLVESVFDIRSTLEERFRRKKGWEVMAAGSGKEALKACASFEPDLIVLDRELCDMDGKDALYSMMSVQSPLIVLLSSKTDEADEVICLGMGVDAYLEKPVSERIVEAECMALFRRMDKTRLGYGKRAIRRGELYIDPSGREVEVGEGKGHARSALPAGQPDQQGRVDRDRPVLRLFRQTIFLIFCAQCVILLAASGGSPAGAVPASRRGPPCLPHGRYVNPWRTPL